MVKVCPVISEAASLRRNVNAPAMSSGSPKRPMGILDSSPAARSGRLSVDAVSSVRTTVGQNRGEVDQAGFAGAVGGAFLDADDSCLRSDVDDGALGSAFDPVPGQGGGQEEAAFEVGVKDGVPVLCGQFQGRFGNVDAGAPGMACPSNRSILEARSQSSPKKALDSRLVTSCEVTVRRYLPTQRPPV